ncbi:uncharacterized protein [Takifugu rubripes]|uniref:uncharacterized protein n=1 Tax=Takifugu rubripes TaxID=31033 RepID=UPI0011451BF2|nr:uncharacterized protein LOC105419108 [Takifugu rubripes]
MDEEVDISNKQASTAEVMLFGVAKRSTETEPLDPSKDTEKTGKDNANCPVVFTYTLVSCLEGFITKLLNTIILPNSDVPKKKKKSKHLSAYPPLHSMLLKKGKKMTKDSNEEDNCLNDSSSVPGPSKLPATLTWKKCSNEGRALMQLDFQQFLMKLEKLTDLRPIPDKEFVETYIKAYYLTENENSPRELDLPIPALMIMLQELF